jgi:hypothetical protein
VGSSPDRSSGMGLADMADTCGVGGHAVGEVGGAGSTEETHAQDSHRTPPK